MLVHAQRRRDLHRKTYLGPRQKKCWRLYCVCSTFKQICNSPLLFVYIKYHYPFAPHHPRLELGTHSNELRRANSLTSDVSSFDSGSRHTSVTVTVTL